LRGRSIHRRKPQGANLLVGRVSVLCLAGGALQHALGHGIVATVEPVHDILLGQRVVLRARDLVPAHHNPRGEVWDAPQLGGLHVPVGALVTAVAFATCVERADVREVSTVVWVLASKAQKPLVQLLILLSATVSQLRATRTSETPASYHPCLR